ncbi:MULTISPECIES: hypothetical protein [Brachybacterium]|uniref:hypothetical protein n=1 Tax=Brachybacterium TaxID=43668 RepID=UPI001141ED96|nr:MULTISPECIES: hypothetical protein [Brachybacterium]
MADGQLSTPRRLQRTGLILCGVGLVGTVVLALVHGGWSSHNTGVIFVLGGLVAFIVGLVQDRLARTGDEDARRR